MNAPELKRFLVNSKNGRLKDVGNSPNFHVKAKNKTDAIAALAVFAARCIDEQPDLTIRNGAWRIITPSMPCGYDITTGEVGRNSGLCSTWEKKREDITEDSASFAYYQTISE